jgi:hypothetical protein
MLRNFLLFCCGMIVLISPRRTTAEGRRRAPDCAGTQPIIPPGAIETYYTIGLVNDTLNFDSLAFLASAAGGGVDVSEFFVTLNSLRSYENSNGNDNTTATVAAMAAQWNATWAALGETLETEGESFAADGDNISAASALHRAAMYLQLAGRFDKLLDPSSLRLFKRSVEVFERAVGIDTPQFPQCRSLLVPYPNASSPAVLHGYWCPSALRTRQDGKQPTIIGITGFDGTAEMQYHSIAVAAVQRGINCLLIEGPGQGFTARTTGLPFIPNYEAVTSRALDFAISTYHIDPSTVILWGESFGGYLAPRGFAFDARFAALVANGGVYDFYQAIVCKLPIALQEMYFKESPSLDAKIDAIMADVAEKNMALAFALNYGQLGFHTTNYTAFLDSLSPYAFVNISASLFSSRPVLVYDPAWDSLTGNQSQIFFEYLSSATNASKKNALVRLDPMRGAGLHCGVGSTANLNIAVHRWINTLFD